MASKKTTKPKKPSGKQTRKPANKKPPQTRQKARPKKPKTTPKKNTAKTKSTQKNTTRKTTPNRQKAQKKAPSAQKRSTWLSYIVRFIKFCGKNRFIKRFILSFTLIITVIIGGFFLPQNMVIPVKDATEKDWHKNSFWFYPWGRSGVHRGIDIFAPVGRPVLAAVNGLVVESGTRSLGGNVITILGAKWRLHYYAHLSEKYVRVGYWVNAGDIIGSVGTTGNAMGKTPHLHYSIRTIFPYVWRSDKTPYGSLKKWYINPTPYFHDYLQKHHDTD